MQKILFTLCFLAISTVGGALLPPLYQSLDELKALLNDPRLIENISDGQAILDIKRVETGYQILTPKYVLMVDVHAKPQKMPGPAQFDLTFRKPEVRAY